jgi:hypothetical protein
LFFDLLELDLLFLGFFLIRLVSLLQFGGVLDPRIFPGREKLYAFAMFLCLIFQMFEHPLMVGQRVFSRSLRVFHPALRHLSVHDRTPELLVEEHGLVLVVPVLLLITTL